MNKYQESLLTAMKILAGKSVEESDASKTIECEIAEVVDEATGNYKVIYANNTFNAIASNSSSYKAGDLVYVLLPTGDFSKTLVIIGPAEENEQALADSEVEDVKIDISNNLIPEVFLPEELTMCTWQGANVNLFNYTDNDTKSELKKFSQILNEYFNKYKNITLSASIRTDIATEQQIRGNYGLLLQLPIIKDDGTGNNIITYKDIYMDVNTMEGNPYDFSSFALQKIVTDMSDVSYYYDESDDAQYLPQLQMFCKDFAQGAKNTPDIFIRDLSIKVTDVLTEEEKSGYNLTLVASNGNFFMSDEDDTTESKIITPNLKIKGKSKKLESYACYQFMRDSNIDTTSDKYSSYGGIGWRCLNQRTEIDISDSGMPVYQQVVNNYTYEITSPYVRTSVDIKCVLVKEDVIVQDIITISRLTPACKCELITTTGGVLFNKDVGSISLVARLYIQSSKYKDESTHTIVATFQRFDKNDTYIDKEFYQQVRKNDQKKDNDQYVNENEITFLTSIVEDSNLIACTFYDTFIDDNGVYKQNIIGTSTIRLYTEEVYDYKLVIVNDTTLYKYDSDGDSPMTCDYDGPNPVQVISPVSYRIYKADGTEFTAEEYKYCKPTQKIPINSMMKFKGESISTDEEYYILKGKANDFIEYKISDVFNSNKLDNKIVLTVEFKDISLTETCYIEFLKDGEMGTNGSKYAAVVTYNGKSYGQISDGKISKLQFVWVNDKDSHKWAYYNSAADILTYFGEGSNPSLSVKVWCDGKEMTDPSTTAERPYSVTQDMYDNTYNKSFVQVNATTGVLTPNPDFSQTENGNDLCAVVQAKVTVGNQGDVTLDGAAESNDYEELYIYYPIEVTYVPKREFIEDKVVETQDEWKLKRGIIPTLNGGFSKVLYSSDGKNPQYNNVEKFIFKDGLSNIDSIHHYVYTWSVGAEVNGKCNLAIPPQGDLTNECKVNPITNFDNGQTNNYVKVEVNAADAGAYERVQTEVAKLDTKLKLVDGYYVQNTEEENYKTIKSIDYRTKEKEYYNGLNIAINNAYNDYDINIKKWLDNLTTKTEGQETTFNTKMGELLTYRNEALTAIDDAAAALVETAEYEEIVLETLIGEKQKIFFRKINNDSIILETLKDAREILQGFIGISFNELPTKLPNELPNVEMFNLSGFINIPFGNNDTINFDTNVYSEDLILNSGLEKYLAAKANYKAAYDKIVEFVTPENEPVQTAYQTFINNFKNYLDKEAINKSPLILLLDASKDVLKNCWLSDNSESNTQPEKDDTFVPLISQELIYNNLYDNLCSIYQRLINIFWKDSRTVPVVPDPIGDIIIQDERTQRKYSNQIDWQKGTEALKRTYLIEDYSSAVNLSGITDVFNEFCKALELFYVENKYKTSADNLSNIITSLEEEKRQLEAIACGDVASDVWVNMTHIRPIIMTYNRYELSHLNGWDGTKLYIDDKHGDNPQYLVAPQIGAGYKETDGENKNAYTGLIMGIKGFNKSTKKDVGLWGFNKGTQSLFLNAKDGSALFGTMGAGQIVIDPTVDKGLIYSASFQADQNDNKPSNYNPSNEAHKGMLIDLTTPEIRFGSGKFSVNSKGEMVAQGGGTIGGQKIGNSELFSDLTNLQGRLTLNSGRIAYEGYYCQGGSGSGSAILYYKDSHFVYIEKNDIIYKITTINSFETYSVVYYQDIQTEQAAGFFSTSENLRSPEAWIQDKDCIKIYTAGYEGGTIYNYNHKNLIDTSNGFYLGKDGLSIGNSIRIVASGDDTTPEILVGKVNSDKKQTISANSSNSFIGYNTTEFKATTNDTHDEVTIDSDASNSEIYIGTNGIRLGSKLAIDEYGNIFAKGTIHANKGSIGNQDIDGGKIVGKGYTVSSTQRTIIKLDANGSIAALIQNKNNNKQVDGDKKQYIDRNGKAMFTDVEITGGSITIKENGNLKAEITNTGNATFKNITCDSVFAISGGNGTQSNGGFSFNGSGGENGQGSVSDESFDFSSKGGTTFKRGTGEGDEGGLTMDKNTTYVGTEKIETQTTGIAATAATSAATAAANAAVDAKFAAETVNFPNSISVGHSATIGNTLTASSALVIPTGSRISYHGHELSEVGPIMINGVAYFALGYRASNP